MYCIGPTVDCGGCIQIDDDFDTHDSLRLYAVTHLGVPQEADSFESTNVRPLSKEEFDGWFHKALTRQGWPIYKYGRGKRVSRCLRIDEGKLSWGSRKEDTSVSRKSICIVDIVEVVREPAPDAPEGTNPDAMLCFIVKDGTGLKVLCKSVVDAVVLSYGFKVLVEAYRKEALQSSSIVSRDVAQ